MKYHNPFNFFEERFINFIKKNNLIKYRSKEIDKKNLNLFFSQKIFSLMYFKAWLINSYNYKEYKFFKKVLEKKFNYEGYEFDLKNFSFRISWFKYLEILIKVIYKIFKLIFQLLLSKKFSKRKVNLYLGGVHRINKNDFIKMFQNNKSDFNRKDCVNLVYSKDEKKINNFIFCKDPIINLVQGFYSFNEKLNLITKIIFFFFEFFIFSLINRNHIIIFIDLLFLKILENIDKKKIIISAVSDVSNFEHIPLWSMLKNKKFNFYFFWNTHSPLYKIKFKNSKPSVNDEIKGRFIVADAHFIDTNQGDKILKKLFNTKIKRFNFVKRHRKKLASSKNTNISVFDTNLNMDKFMFGKNLKSYWNLKNMKNFVNDILDTTEKISKTHKIKININLKRKSNPETSDEIEYQSFIKDKSKKNKNLNILDTKLNLYETLVNSDLVICYPWTNPGFISGLNMKIKTIYYDPTNTLDNVLNDNKIIFLQNNKILFKYLNKFLKKK